MKSILVSAILVLGALTIGCEGPKAKTTLSPKEKSDLDRIAKTEFERDVRKSELFPRLAIEELKCTISSTKNDSFDEISGGMQNCRMKIEILVHKAGFTVQEYDEWESTQQNQTGN